MGCHHIVSATRAHCCDPDDRQTASSLIFQHQLHSTSNREKGPFFVVTSTDCCHMNNILFFFFFCKNSVDVKQVKVVGITVMSPKPPCFWRAEWVVLGYLHGCCSWLVLLIWDFESLKTEMDRERIPALSKRELFIQQIFSLFFLSHSETTCLNGNGISGWRSIKESSILYLKSRILCVAAVKPAWLGAGSSCSNK